MAAAGRADAARIRRWRGIVVTRSELSLDDPDVIALPAWLLDS